MEKRSVSKVGALAVGVPTRFPILDKDGHLMLRAGYVIKDGNELSLIRELMGDNEDSEFLGIFQPVSVPPKDNPFDLFGMIKERVSDLLHGGIATAVNFQSNTLAICDLIQDMCYEDEDIAIGSSFLDKNTQYTIKHPIQTAVVCEAIAKGMDSSKEDRKSILAAALTMNISSIALHEKLQTQKDPLPKTQKLAIFDHPLADFKTLQGLHVVDETWLTAVLQHHEAIDGSGYPQGLRGTNVTVAAQLVSLSDIYTAMVSSRSYRLPMPANEAMKKIFLTASQKVNELFASLFIKKLGIYPPGTIVRLQNGEVGIVTYRGKSANHPTVQTIIATNGKPYSIPHHRDTSAREYNVVETIPQSKIDVTINNQQIWGYGDFAKKGIAKRRHVRATASCKAEVISENAGKDTPPIRASVTNINETGCLIKIPVASLREPVRGDSSYRLSFTVMGKSLTDIRFIMRNASMNDNEHHIGVKFIDLPAEYETIIGLYLKTAKV
ncbi:MAG: PilZ domain-containing protein [Nitrospirae bacterium]|nr:PilZ domain-containing protein [Nitrospirota bacterium]